jgi:aminoglycoside phosphotransferase (APT) family kinase protein
LPKVFLHGDIYSTHLLWDSKDKKLGLIDFSDMNIGDPAFDFAELYEYGQEFIEQVYKLYKGPKDDSFLERAWIYQRWVGVFMMINHFETHKTSFEVARQTFDRVKSK